jgi:hypothetical protein
MVIRTMLCVLCLVLATARVAVGQQRASDDWSAVQSLPFGTQIRVRSVVDGTNTGRFRGASVDTLSVERDGMRIEIPRHEVVEIARSRVALGSGRATKVGATAGAVIGAVSGYRSARGAKAFWAIIKGGGGFLVGSIFGAVVDVAVGVRPRYAVVFRIDPATSRMPPPDGR